MNLQTENEALRLELTASRAELAASAEILRAISRSAFDLQPVLDTLIHSAAQLCGAIRGSIFLRDGDVFPLRATSRANPAFVEYYRTHPPTAGRGSAAQRVIQSGRVEMIADVFEDAEIEAPPDALRRMGVRAILGAPLLRGGRVEGVIALTRPTPGVFSQRQIDLVQTFADQAVIAIENARLFEEVQAKTQEVSEALEQQQVSGEILGVISNSIADAQPVFDKILASCKHLFGGDELDVLLVDEQGELHIAAYIGEFHDVVAATFPAPVERTPAGRAIAERRVMHWPDLVDGADVPGVLRKMAKLTGYRSMAFAPMLSENRGIGAIGVARSTGPFKPKELVMLKTFADQAVIAIQNARLFNETREALAQQTATADVLKVISRSAFDLDTVFQTLVTTAVDLCKASSGTLCVSEGDRFRYRGMAGPEATAELQRYLEDHPLVAPTRNTIAGRAILSRQTEQIPDVLAEDGYAVPFAAHGSPARSLLGVPLLGKTQVLGAIVVARREPGPFPPRHIEILRTFADQAVIAIENSRLFEQVQARTRELEQSLEDLRRTQDRLVQSEKLASLGQLTAGIAHEIKNPLNFVNNFATLSRELLGEVREMLAPAPLAADARADVDELMNMLDSNLDKVAHHGKRADSIVKNMLLHSREGSGERARANVNAIVEEALNLGYHGARAEKPGFNVTIEKSFDLEAGEADLYLQEITRVLLNLVANGFYATAKRAQVAGAAYQPTLTASTRSLGDHVEIRIRDNGTGIPPEVRAKMFNPFFTTKPAGEGTGLGLSLSHDIVVKQHGGAIEVETEPGAFTEFIVTLPRGAATV